MSQPGCPSSRKDFGTTSPNVSEVPGVMIILLAGLANK